VGGKCPAPRAFGWACYGRLKSNQRTT